MDFFFAELGAQIDWSKRPRFRDKELAGIGFGHTPDGMVADKLVEVCLLDGSVQWVLIHVEVQAQRDASLARQWQLTKLLYQHGWRKQRIIVLFKVINWMMALPAAHQDRYWQAVLELEKERKVEWITPLERSFMDKGWKMGLEQGMEKGLEQGLEQGRKEGAAALLERQLARRFGPLPQAVRARLAEAGAEQVAAWSDALPEAQSLRQVFGE